MDDKGTKEAFSWLDKVKQALASVGAKREEAPPQATLASICAGIKTQSGKAYPGPATAVMNLGDYEYRTPKATKWAEEASLGIDVAALAWTLSSEAPDISKYPQYAVAIAEAVLTAAKRTANSVAYRTLKDNRLNDLYFGRQPGRWCSTFQPPTWRHVHCALLTKLAREQGIDLVAGKAERWIDGKTQSYLSKRSGGKTLTPEQVVIKWGKEGWQWIGARSELDSYVLMLFEKVNGPADTAPALEAIANGRARWKDPR